MPHQNESCFSCKHSYSQHGPGKCPSPCKCTSFEFVAASKRDPGDIVSDCPFKSKSSNKTYITTFWRQGDYSCTCIGWRNHRKCEHIQKFKANNNKAMNPGSYAYENEQAPVSNIVSSIANKLADLESGKANISFSDVQAEIEYNSAFLSSAADVLNKRLEEAKAKILGDAVSGVQSLPVKEVEKPKKILSADNPFGD
jgi:hypothetical protein